MTNTSPTTKPVQFIRAECHPVCSSLSEGRGRELGRAKSIHYLTSKILAVIQFADELKVLTAQ